MMIMAKLLKPLDGRAPGEHVEFTQADFERLRLRRAVEAVEVVVAAPVVKMAEAPANKMLRAPANKSAPKP